MNRDEIGAGSYVLIVEDDVEVAAQLSELLRAAGYASVTTYNGRVAREALVSGALPSLILLDLLMPELDGFGLLKALRADPECRKIPVCVVSALGVETVASADVSMSLRKPIDPGRLLAVVERHCQRTPPPRPAADDT